MVQFLPSGFFTICSVLLFFSPPSYSLFALDCFKLLMNFFTHMALFFSSLNFPQCVVLETKEEAAAAMTAKNILTIQMINTCCVICYNLVTSLLTLLFPTIFSFPQKKYLVCVNHLFRSGTFSIIREIGRFF